MTLDQIFAEWDKDVQIDKTNLGNESIDISKLHNKYYKIYIAEKAKLIKLETDFKRLNTLRYDFFAGSLDDDTLKEMGWMEEFAEVGRKKIIRSDIQRYLDGDHVMIDAALKLGLQKEKVALVDSIIKIISVRNFHIKNAIDWAKFQVGL